MTQFKLQALHVPSGEVITYGPWEVDDNPITAAFQAGFANGFISGLVNKQGGEPEDLRDFELLEVPAVPDARVIGQIVTHADASVGHPDGSVD